jgi:hypothetical protein
MTLFQRAAALVTATLLGFASSTFILSAPRPEGGSTERPDLLFVQAPVVRPGLLTERFPKGSRIVRLDGQSKTPVNLTPDFFAAADPRISFDASRVLFAGKKETSARWQIWEMNSDGSEKRQVTHCSGDCLAPAYLPRGEIVYTAILPEESGRVSQAFVSKLDGSEGRQITFGPGDYRVETVLENGRILISANYPLRPRGRTASARLFYTLRSDGSGLAAFRCEHGQPFIRDQAEELSDGSLVFIKKSVLSRQTGGQLAEIRRGALHNSIITTPQMLAYSPRQLSPDELVVARATATRKGSQDKLALYAFDAANGKFGQIIYEDPSLSSVAAVPVTAHERPRGYWSTLNPKLNAGYFICLDSYLSSAAPRGRMTATISKVRVLTLDPNTRHEASLGEAPVEKDGSFYIAVPPDRPVRFEVLDEGGRVLRAQRSWIWARSGEEHGCVGCHEDRAIAPENRWPLTLRRFDTPTRLGVAATPKAAH